MKLFNKYLNQIITIGMVVIAMFFTSLYYNAKLSSVKQVLAEYKQEVLRASADNAIKQQHLQQSQIKKIGELENAHLQKTLEYEDWLNDVYADVDSGKRRLYIQTSNTCKTLPTSTATASGFNATQGGWIGEKDTKEILKTASSCDQTTAQLTALQDYVRNVCLAEKKPP